MGLLDNLKEKIFGQKAKTAPPIERKQESTLDFKKFEQEAFQTQVPDATGHAHNEPKGNTVKDILQEKTEKLGEQVIEKGREWKEKAIALGDILGERAEALMQKAEAEAAKEKKSEKESFFEKAHRKGKEYDEKVNDSQRTFQDSLREAKKSTLTDDFFTKAAKYANSEYGTNSTKPTILTSDTQKKQASKNDRNDSDDLIEDAIIEK
ncbi:MAG: hypothetical protein K9I02_04510 [Haliscomenobacter sp.]|nr:hypothetical protein [Haliscomenobacter sp.]